jgi:hypothetical protein
MLICFFSISVDICSWRKLVTEAQFLRYQWFLLKAFVDNSPKSMGEEGEEEEGEERGRGEGGRKEREEKSLIVI